MFCVTYSLLLNVDSAACTIDFFVFFSRCGQGPHPLMNTIKNVLGPAKGQYAGISDGEGIGDIKIPGTTVAPVIPDEIPEEESAPEPEGTLRIKYQTSLRHFNE